MKIKLFHEAPISIFKQIQSFTDGDYALVHLFDEIKEYKQLFVDALKQGREVILDNSIFELGEAFDPDRFAYYIEDIRPTWYIIPDSLENYRQTTDNLDFWLTKYHSLPGKKIGVVQGKSVEEIVDCYRAVEPHVDMVGISFDYSLFEKWYPELKTKFHSWMRGRITLLKMLDDMGVINRSKPHHLLGCGLPQEGLIGKYASEYSWIYSADTSNPVVHGMVGKKYAQNEGLSDKHSQKLFTMITSHVNDVQMEDIVYNVKEFRKYWSA